MAITRGPAFEATFEAENDLSSKQYYIMKHGSSAGQVDTADATGPYVGVLQNKPGSGEEARVVTLGHSLVVTDGSSTNIAAGDRLAADANGKAVKTTTDNDEIVGIALGASTADGVIIEMLVIPGLRC